MVTIIRKSTRFGANMLLNHLKQILATPTDAALARSLGLTASVISKLRTGSPLTPDVALRIHDCTDLPLRSIYVLASMEQEGLG